MPFIDVGGRPAYHEIHGDGEPVVLLHGGFCSLENLRAVGDLLSERHAVHAAERPGHGRTADREGPYHYADMADETLAYLDAVGLASAHLVGFSDGAIIGLLLARDHPERVRSLAAISGNLNPHGFVPDDYPHVTVPQEQHDRLSRAYAELSPDGAGHADAVLEKLMQMWLREPDIAEASLAAVGAPTLVMAGEHDQIAEQHTRAIAAAVPRAELTIVPGTTHMLVSERPDLVAARVFAFLEGIPTD